MARPNSKTTLIRRVLVKIIAPHPDAGEAWCLDCSMNDGKTLVLQADGAYKHVESHLTGDNVSVDIQWPPRKKEDS